MVERIHECAGYEQDDEKKSEGAQGDAPGCAPAVGTFSQDALDPFDDVPGRESGREGGCLALGSARELDECAGDEGRVADDSGGLLVASPFGG